MAGRTDIATTKRKEDIGLELLLFRHIDRMSENMKDGFSIQKSNADKLLTYRIQTKHFENLLIAELDDAEYYKKLKEFKTLASQFAWSTNIESNIKYYDSVSDWFQLLFFHARKKGYFSKKLTILPQNEMDANVD